MTSKKKVLLAHIPYKTKGGEEIHVEELRDVYEGLGYEVVFLPESFFRHTFFKTICSLLPISHFSFFDRLLESEKFDFIHLNNAFPLLGPRFFRWVTKKKIPTIMTIHNHRFYCTNGLVLRKGKECTACKNTHWLWRSVLFNCNGSYFKSIYHSISLTQLRRGDFFNRAITLFIAPSRYIADELIESGVRAERVRYVMHGTDSPLIKRAPDQSQRSYDVIYAGRLSVEKGIHTLVECIRTMPDISFLIVGDGPEQDLIAHTAKECANLTVVGRKTHSEVLDSVGQSKIGVLPSICNEILSLFLLEILNQGKYCVVSDKKSIRRFAEDKDATILFKTGDISSLASSIRWALAKEPIPEAEVRLIRARLSRKRFSAELDAVVGEAIRHRAE